MERLLLVDGSNLLFQMFYGMPSRIITKDGKAIHGTLGFVGALLKIIRMTAPTHIAVLFDGEHENPRTAIDDNYKSNRTDYSFMPEEETPFSQLPDIYRALDLLNICHTETLIYETDDVIASYALRYGRNMEVVISSFDSDFFQLLGKNVSILRYRGKNTALFTERTLLEKYGITPNQYADFKSLTGDASDNIKGAEKVGVKTAAKLLGEFGTLCGLIQNSENIKSPSVRESIIRNADRLKRNYELIRLTETATIPFDIVKLAYTPTGLTASEVLRGIGL